MRGFAAIGLYAPSREGNVGGVFRAAAVYEASAVFIQGPNRAAMKCIRHQTNTPASERHIPFVITEDLMKCTPVDTTVVGVEIVDGSTSLSDFVHPERGYYIFGPETGSIPPGVLLQCHEVVHVPSPSGFCMNLAACANVVLYDRFIKHHMRGVP